MFKVEKRIWSWESKSLFWQRIAETDGLKKAQFGEYVIREDFDWNNQPGRWLLDGSHLELHAHPSLVPMGCSIMIELAKVEDEEEWENIVIFIKEWLDKCIIVEKEKEKKIEFVGGWEDDGFDYHHVVDEHGRVLD